MKKKNYINLYSFMAIVCLLLIFGSRSYAIGYQDVYENLSKGEKEQLEDSLFWLDRLGEFSHKDKSAENFAIFTSMEQIVANYLGKNYKIDKDIIISGKIPDKLSTDSVDIAPANGVDWYLKNFWNISPSHTNPKIEYPVSYYKDGKYYKYFHNFPLFSKARTKKLYDLGNGYYCLEYSKTYDGDNFQEEFGKYYAILKKKTIDNKHIYTPIYNQNIEENININQIINKYVDKSRPVSPTASRVLVNGKEEKFQAYNIDSSNYFKLRDLAHIFNNTGSSFSVSWDNSSKSIAIQKGASYKPVGGEMKFGPSNKKERAIESKTKLIIDGQQIELKAYTIAGNNYFKLRDLADKLDFNVDWDGRNKVVLIDSK